MCVMVERQNGQPDTANRMVSPMPELERVFASFDWQVHRVEATQYDGVYAALEHFRFGPRTGKPTAIICHGTNGHGALSDFLNKHKVAVPDALLTQEHTLQSDQRRARTEEFNRFFRGLAELRDGPALQEALLETAGQMRLDVAEERSGDRALGALIGPVRTKRAPKRAKAIRYDPPPLPPLAPHSDNAPTDIVT